MRDLVGRPGLCAELFLSNGEGSNSVLNVTFSSDAFSAVASNIFLALVPSLVLCELIRLDLRGMFLSLNLFVFSIVLAMTLSPQFSLTPFSSAMDKSGACAVGKE